MTKVLVSALAVVLPILAFATPSYATKGIDAARACEAKPKCIASYGEDGSVVIIVGDTMIDCPGPQKECTVIRVRPTVGVFNPAIRNSGKSVLLGN
ncbi:MAG: hypothetical protein ACYC0C_04080 [Devosia sp.]